ncbi:response regulator [Paenibacillus pasadenensis]|nr:response regulator [Paenibacillus pasadenensis]
MDGQTTAYRVMIVDDEAILRTGMVHLCRWSDFGIEIVAQASNGKEALQAIGQAQPHVVLTDIVMPVMDGVELTRELRTLHPEIGIIVLSSYSEYNYVREVFKYGVTDYLLKPKVSAGELVSLIQSLCSGMAPERLRQPMRTQEPSLLLGRWLESEEPDVYPVELAEQFTAGRFLLLKASTSLALSRTKWNQGQLESMLLELAAEQLAEWRHESIFLKHEMVLLLHYVSEEEDGAKAALNRYAEAAREALTYLSFVQSEPFQAFEDIKSQQERLTPYLGKLIYYSGAAAVPEAEIASCDRHSEQPAFNQSLFAASLRIYSIEDVRTQLKAFFSELSATHSMDEYSLKRFAQNLIYTALSLLEAQKQPVAELGKSRLRLFKLIDLAFHIEELEEILLQFLDDLKGILPCSDKQQSAILQQIYAYVDENFDSDISLSEMADKLHMNYSYLSTYFKQRANENLTSYINRVRIGKAQELLHRQDLTVSEISRLTGYSDHNYFSKVFKKKTGMTPIEYRNQTSW